VSEPFTPIGDLTPKQTAIVSQLLLKHPEGLVEKRAGVPYFVSRTTREIFEVNLLTLATRFEKYS
jgi:hypothetical protein